MKKNTVLKLKTERGNKKKGSRNLEQTITQPHQTVTQVIEVKTYHHENIDINSVGNERSKDIDTDNLSRRNWNELGKIYERTSVEKKWASLNKKLHNSKQVLALLGGN
jgi:hypothetical protein